jgi:hypothetical protein
MNSGQKENLHLIDANIRLSPANESPTSIEVVLSPQEGKDTQVRMNEEVAELIGNEETCERSSNRPSLTVVVDGESSSDGDGGVETVLFPSKDGAVEELSSQEEETESVASCLIVPSGVTMPGLACADCDKDVTAGNFVKVQPSDPV